MFSMIVAISRFSYLTSLPARNAGEIKKPSSVQQSVSGKAEATADAVPGTGTPEGIRNII